MTFNKCKIPYCPAKANHAVLIKSPSGYVFQLHTCYWHKQLAMFNPRRLLESYPSIMPPKARGLLEGTEKAIA